MQSENMSFFIGQVIQDRPRITETNVPLKRWQGYYWSRLNILIGRWEKGRAIYVFRGGKSIDYLCWVASQYEILTRVRTLSYKHHQIAAAENVEIQMKSKNIGFYSQISLRNKPGEAFRRGLMLGTREIRGGRKAK